MSTLRAKFWQRQRSCSAECTQCNCAPAQRMGRLGCVNVQQNLHYGWTGSIDCVLQISLNPSSNNTYMTDRQNVPIVYCTISTNFTRLQRTKHPSCSIDNRDPNELNTLIVQGQARHSARILGCQNPTACAHTGLTHSLRCLHEMLRF